MHLLLSCITCSISISLSSHDVLSFRFRNSNTAISSRRCDVTSASSIQRTTHGSNVNTAAWIRLKSSSDNRDRFTSSNSGRRVISAMFLSTHPSCIASVQRSIAAWRIACAVRLRSLLGLDYFDNVTNNNILNNGVTAQFFFPGFTVITTIPDRSLSQSSHLTDF